MHISMEQEDALTELINIGVGHAASTLNSLINHKIRLTVPSIEFCDIQSIKKNFSLNDGDVSSVSMSFQGDYDGSASLVFPLESARTLVAILTGEDLDSTELDELRSGTLAEVGNILLNGVMGSMANMLASRVEYTLPMYQESSVENMLGKHDIDIILMARANFYIDELCVEGNILLFFELQSFHGLLQAIDKELLT